MRRRWRQDCNPDSNANSNPYPNKDCRSCDLYEHAASHRDADSHACSNCYSCAFANANASTDEHFYIYIYPANEYTNNYSSNSHTNHDSRARDRGRRARHHLW